MRRVQRRGLRVLQLSLVFGAEVGHVLTGPSPQWGQTGLARVAAMKSVGARGTTIVVVVVLDIRTFAQDQRGQSEQGAGGLDV
jgi:hypothetical protein